MQRLAVLLSGEHPTLPAAELRALLAVHDAAATFEAHGSIAVVTPGQPAATRAALGRLALAHEWGPVWGMAPDTPEGVSALALAVRSNTPGRGKAAVSAERRGPSGRSTRDQLERVFGAALKESGHDIDLAEPDLSVYAWIEDGRIVVGRSEGTIDRGQHEARCSVERAHFSPVSLHPRRAASLVHLARVPPGGRIYDPFCGTGALVLEAAVEGYDAWGSDLDAFMVQGTLETLADAAAQPLAGQVFEADIGAAPGLVAGVQGICTDLPYGRASSSHDEGLAVLYDRALAAFHSLLPPTGYAVVGCAQPDLLRPAAHGLHVRERHAERVHRSLTRHYLVLQKDAV